MAKTTAEKIAVMQAYIDGKVIEVSETFSAPHSNWSELPSGAVPTWAWDVCDYRVKPENG